MAGTQHKRGEPGDEAEDRGRRANAGNSAELTAPVEHSNTRRLQWDRSGMSAEKMSSNQPKSSPPNEAMAPSGDQRSDDRAGQAGDERTPKDGAAAGLASPSTKSHTDCRQPAWATHSMNSDTAEARANTPISAGVSSRAARRSSAKVADLHDDAVSNGLGERYRNIER